MHGGATREEQNLFESDGLRQRREKINEKRFVGNSCYHLKVEPFFFIFCTRASIRSRLPQKHPSIISQRIYHQRDNISDKNTKVYLIPRLPFSGGMLAGSGAVFERI